MNDPGTLAVTKAWLENQIIKVEADIAFHNGRIQFLAAQHESHTQRLASLTGETPQPPSEEFDFSNPMLDDCYQYGCDMDGNTPPAMD